MLSKSFRIATGLVFLGIAALGTTGCPTRDISQLDSTPVVEVMTPITVKTNRQVDILFVIDNSDSMREEQASLTTNFGKFINRLTTVQGGLPDVHLGVISSDVGIGPNFMQQQCNPGGDRGDLQNTPRTAGCPVPNNGARFISDVAAPGSDGGTRIQNYNGGIAALPDVFKCIAQLGITGCGFEQHLESMEEALDGSNTGNAGFLRDDAYLAVIILADEDDCSAQDPSLFDPNPQLNTSLSLYGANTSYRCTEWGVTCDGMTLPRVAADYTTCGPRADSPYLWHPQHYFDFLKNDVKKGNSNLLIGAVIAGNPTPFGVTLDSDGAPELKHSCSSGNGVADPGVRLKYFADQFGPRGKFVSICQSDLSDALDTVAELLAKVIGTPCLDDKVSAQDIDPNVPGIQVDCQVSDVTAKDTSAESETVIPRCDMMAIGTTGAGPTATGARPCWWTSIETGTCPASPTGLVLHVERSVDTLDVTEVVRCSTSAIIP
jgi:hypothetical protein